MPPRALHADSRSSCQLSLVTHTDKHVGDQETSKQTFQVIFTKLLSSGLLGYEVLCPTNCLTHLNPLFLLPSYNAYPRTPLAPPEPTVSHWEPEQCRCGEGKSTQGYGQLQHCPSLGLLSASRDPFGAERRKWK